MVENSIKSETKLFAIANEQKKAGKEDLANFVLLRSTKVISDLLENTRTGFLLSQGNQGTSGNLKIGQGISGKIRKFHGCQGKVREFY